MYYLRMSNILKYLLRQESRSTSQSKKWTARKIPSPLTGERPSPSRTWGLGSWCHQWDQWERWGRSER